MSDENRCPSLRGDFDGLTNLEFNFGVQTAGRLVEDDNRRILDQCSGNPDSLTFTTGELDSTFAD